MRQQSETCHVLMMRERRNDKWLVWRTPLEAKYRDAEMLAYQGRLIESLEEAEKALCCGYGRPAATQFRIETTTKTVTTLEPQEEWEQ